MLLNNKNIYIYIKQNKNTHIYVENLRREKPRVEEKKIHYIKKLIQKGRDARDYIISIDIIALILYIIANI